MLTTCRGSAVGNPSCFGGWLEGSVTTGRPPLIPHAEGEGHRKGHDQRAACFGAMESVAQGAGTVRCQPTTMGQKYGGCRLDPHHIRRSDVSPDRSCRDLGTRTYRLDDGCTGRTRAGLCGLPVFPLGQVRAASRIVVRSSSVSCGEITVVVASSQCKDAPLSVRRGGVFR
jgi:hypothetical protein